jgi:hypothetical protein
VHDTKVFEYYDIYHDIFYINRINTCLKIKYSKIWYLVDICKKLIITIKVWIEVEFEIL